MTATNYQSEIVQITGCTDEEAIVLHEALVAHFGNLGSVKFSRFASQAKKMYLILMLKYSRN